MKSLILVLCLTLFSIVISNYAFALEDDPADGNCGFHECLQEAVDLYEEGEICSGELSDSIAFCQADYLLCTLI